MVLWIGFDLQAEIVAVCGSNWTALRFASWKCRDAVAAQLLQAVASVRAVDDGGQTPLHLAASYVRSSIANLLLKANVSHTAVASTATPRRNVRSSKATATSRRCCSRQNKPQP